MGLRITRGRSVHPSVTAAEVSAALPFVIPSEAEGSAVLFPTHDHSWKRLSTELSWACGPPKGMKIANTSGRSVHPSSNGC